MDVLKTFIEMLSIYLLIFLSKVLFSFRLIELMILPIFAAATLYSFLIIIFNNKLLTMKQKENKTNLFPEK